MSKWSTRVSPRSVRGHHAQNHVTALPRTTDSEGPSSRGPFRMLCMPPTSYVPETDISATRKVGVLFPWVKARSLPTRSIAANISRRFPPTLMPLTG